MKVLWLCSWYPNELDPFDGDFVERHAKALSLYAEVYVIHVVQNHEWLQGKEYKEQVLENGNLQVQTVILPFPDTGLSIWNKLIFNNRYQKNLKEQLRRYIRNHGKPDLVHVHVPVKAGAGALWLKKNFNVPFVVTEHTSAYFEDIPFHYASRNIYFRYVTRKTFKEALAVSSVSDWLLKRLKELFQLQQTRLIRNTVDTSLFYPVQRSNTDVTRFLHVSMMVPLKNVTGILQAFLQLQQKRTDWELVLAGPAPEEIRQHVQVSGLQNKVSFTGALSYAEVALQMQQADALVHFSKYENLPCVINEALCCGMPVISSDVGGISELVNESNGILVKEGDCNSLAAALDFFMDNRHTFHNESIAAAAQQQYGFHVTGRELIRFYESLLPGTNPSVLQ